MCTSFYQLFLPFTTYFAYSNKIAKRSEPHNPSLSLSRDANLPGKHSRLPDRNLRQTFNERKMYERVNVKVCTCSSNDVKRDKQFDVECRGCNYPNKSIESKSMVITWANSFSRQRNALDFVSKFKQKSHSVHSVRWWFTIISKQIRNAHTHQTSSTRRRSSEFVRSCARFVYLFCFHRCSLVVRCHDSFMGCHRHYTVSEQQQQSFNNIFALDKFQCRLGWNGSRRKRCAFGLRSQYAELPSIAAVVVSLNFNGTPVIRFVSCVFVRPHAKQQSL